VAPAQLDGVRTLAERSLGNRAGFTDSPIVGLRIACREELQVA
jgi:hypothetical protein